MDNPRFFDYGLELAVRIDFIEPPREFTVGRGEIISLKDCARVHLEADEQITLTTPAGGEYDVARKSWGFYATPSLNSRLKSFGLKAALTGGPDGKYYIFLLESGKEAEFDRYLQLEQNRVLAWLDSAQAVEELLSRPATPQTELCCPCGQNRFSLRHIYQTRPEGEIFFPDGRAHV